MKTSGEVMRVQEKLAGRRWWGFAGAYGTYCPSRFPSQPPVKENFTTWPWGVTSFPSIACRDKQAFLFRSVANVVTHSVFASGADT